MVHVGFIGSRAKFEARAGYPIETTNSATMLATILCLRPFANQLCYLPVSSLDMPTIGMWLPQGTHASRNHKPVPSRGGCEQRIPERSGRFMPLICSMECVRGFGASRSSNGDFNSPVCKGCHDDE
ncbi:hypothetical protein C4D60_Mb05t10970 [Musa balbisiana]|uniref:Uncharacterized protein n=1 Tax=Musa balbisiana TaxID=52838 RepID=A0A4V4H827_MUSBA|nr:hypothetical protein C4D60_Mb05t10970 [Musa balbisiana]